MKIALAQLNYHIGNFESNYSKIRNAILKAKKNHADLVVFAELALTGYPPRDFLVFDDFIKQSEKIIKKIIKDSKGIGVIIGCPTKNPAKEGKGLFNSAYFIADGKIYAIVHKTLLPTYDIFDEARYFESNTTFETIKYKGKKIALTICEDLWNTDKNPLYTFSPMDKLIRHKPDLVINISASPFDYKHREERIRILRYNAKKYHLPVFYLNHVGSQTELIFDGGSMVMDKDGGLQSEMSYFTEDFKIYDLAAINYKSGKRSTTKTSILTKTERIHSALVLGIRDYFQKMNFQKAILGLSGGIDSAVVLVLAVEALGKENVRAILMPSEFSSEHSAKDAKKLAENIGVQYEIIPIQSIVKEYRKTLSGQFKNLPFNIAEENIQSRTRGNIIMALANKFGYIMLNTSNKSELAVGYGTLYGDMAGGLSVLGDVYKTEIYEMSLMINSQKKIIPQNIIVKPPSAELKPNQKDTDTLPEYKILDKLLYEYIEKKKSPDELIKMGFDKKLVFRVLKMVNSNEYKRYQFPPVLRISSKAFGMGRRMPIVGKYL